MFIVQQKHNRYQNPPWCAQFCISSDAFKWVVTAEHTWRRPSKGEKRRAVVQRAPHLWSFYKRFLIHPSCLQPSEHIDIMSLIGLDCFLCPILPILKQKKNSSKKGQNTSKIWCWQHWGRWIVFLECGNSAKQVQGKVCTHMLKLTKMRSTFLWRQGIRRPLSRSINPATTISPHCRFTKRNRNDSSTPEDLLYLESNKTTVTCMMMRSICPLLIAVSWSEVNGPENMGAGCVARLDYTSKRLSSF